MDRGWEARGRKDSYSATSQSGSQALALFRDLTVGKSFNLCLSFLTLYNRVCVFIRHFYQSPICARCCLGYWG